MKHLGDITKLSGHEVPIVDVITGGSPCQDLSVAGKRAGLAGERSGLFMEQMRIVKEMREQDERTGRPAQYVRPRYMVWENVPGAFSSGSPKGSDFQAVLEEIVRVVCKEAPPVPIPKEGWPKAGCISGVGDSGCTFSIAWRVHDAQFWGVPQRRKRIALVADFGGLSAPEILFERKGLRWDSESGAEAGKAAAGAVGSGVASASPIAVHLLQDPITAIDSTPCLSAGSSDRGQAMLGVMQSVETFAAYGIDQQGGKGGANYTEDVCPPILSDSHGTPHAVAYGVGCDVYNQEITGNVAASLTAACGGTNTSGAKVLCLNDQGGSVMGVSEDVTGALRAQEHGHPPAVAIGNGQLNQMSMAEQANTLDTMHDQQAVMVAIASCAANAEITTNNVSPSLLARAGTGGNNMPSITSGATVRRLTPLECERLQGYPDGWTSIGEWTDSKGKKHKDADSPRYKALGNSIALPFWQWLARRICAEYERPVTMASLFDGIGGFPLVFQRCGATPVWASEIEEFPIAVTKKHFPEEENER